MESRNRYGFALATSRCTYFSYRPIPNDNRQRDVKLGHVRCVTISVDTILPEVNKLKGGVITSIIKGTLAKALHCGEINCM